MLPFFYLDPLPADDGRRRRGASALLVDVVRNRRSREVAGRRLGVGVRRRRSALVVLIIFGWMYQVLPGGPRDHDAGKPTYAWGPFRRDPNPVRSAVGDGWARVQLHGLRGPDACTPSTTTSCRRWPRSARPVRVRPGAVGEQRARQRQVRHDDGADAAAALDRRLHRRRWRACSSRRRAPRRTTSSPRRRCRSSRSNPVRELRYVNNDAAIGVPYLQALGVSYVMVRTAEAKAQADAQPELHLIDDERPVGHLPGRRLRHRRAADRAAGRGRTSARATSASATSSSARAGSSTATSGRRSRPTTAPTTGSASTSPSTRAATCPIPTRPPSTATTRRPSRSTSSCPSEPIEPVRARPARRR